MSDTITHAPDRDAESISRPNESRAIPVDWPQAVADDSDANGPSMTDELAQAVGFVLGQARRRADADATPDNSRAILHVASSFAEDLSKNGFDGAGFFRAFFEAQR